MSSGIFIQELNSRVVVFQDHIYKYTCFFVPFFKAKQSNEPQQTFQKVSSNFYVSQQHIKSSSVLYTKWCMHLRFPTMQQNAP